jgi:hypothetical protein
MSASSLFFAPARLFPQNRLMCSLQLQATKGESNGHYNKEESRDEKESRPKEDDRESKTRGEYDDRCRLAISEERKAF